jgi:hypothetical protein
MNSSASGENHQSAERSEREMSTTRYEIVLEGESSSQGRVPRAGETVQFDGAVWEVERVETSDECPRVHLVQASVDGAEVEAHRRRPPLTPPTTFESELVYTLTDLSTRLSTLAQVLKSYWGKGAA